MFGSSKSYPHVVDDKLKHLVFLHGWTNGNQCSKENHEQGAKQHYIKSRLLYRANSTTAGGDGHKISNGPGDIECTNKKSHTDTP
jgi:hypothetical protein